MTPVREHYFLNKKSNSAAIEEINQKKAFQMEKRKKEKMECRSRLFTFRTSKIWSAWRVAVLPQWKDDTYLPK